MLHHVRSLGLSGVSGYEVTAECDLSGGLPAFDLSLIHISEPTRH